MSLARVSRPVTPAVLLLAAGLWTAAQHGAVADLVAHFDPNVASSLFQDGGENEGGTIPVTDFGQPVGWMTDVRSPTPGWDGEAIDGFLDIQQRNDPVKPSYRFHPTGGMLVFGGNDNLLAFDGDVGERMDGVNEALDTNVMQTVIAGRAAAGGSGPEYFLDVRDAGAVDGFALRYNHDTFALEGVVRGETVASVPTPVGEYFVANLVWDGAGSSATLNVATRTGTDSSAGTPSNNDPIDHDRFRLGSSANNGNNLTGLMGDVYLWNDTSDQSALVSQLAEDYSIIPELVVDRATGNISITLPSGVDPLTNVAGYQMTSESGTLNPAEWLSVAENYDADNPGGSQVDPDNNWTVLSDSDSRNDLSELDFEQSGGANNGADFLAGESTDLGNAWIPYFLEDLEMLLVLDDGSTQDLSVRFTGNDGRPYEFGDLNFDGDITNDDFFDVFVPNYGDDTSELLSSAEMYGQGDLNEDGAITLEDFLLFNDAYMAANPGAAPLSFSGAPVPEPATWMLACLGAAAVVARRYAKPLATAAACLAMLSIFASRPAQAEVGGVLDVDFQWLTPGSELNDGTRIQDLSGNRYHGFWGGGGAANNTPVESAFGGPNTIVNNEDTNGFIILRPDIPDGGDGAPNDWWGEGNSPSPYFALDANTSYTFEAVLNWNGNDQGNDGIMGQTGGNEWWIRENGGSLEYVFDDGPNRNVNTGTIDIDELVDNTDWHHVGLTFARDAGDPTQVTVTTFIDRQEVFQETLANGLGTVGDPTADIRLGSYNTSARFDGQLGHFRISDEVLDPSEFLEVPMPPEFILEVNTVTGQVSVQNETGFDLTMDAYRLTSENGSLDASGWTSLESQDFEGQGENSGWTELGDTANEISEGFLGGASTLGSPSLIELGAIYGDLGNEDETLRFEYHVPGEPDFRDMLVQFTDEVSTLAGDFNGDGQVDLADYTVWRDNLGAPNESALLGNGDGENGVDAGDYDLWKANIGTTNAAIGASTSAVPEPATVTLALLGVIGVVTGRRSFATRWARVAAVAALGLVVSVSSALATTNDRLYHFGDPETSDPEFGANIGEGNPMGFEFDGDTVTGDEVGPLGGFSDLIVSGATYTSVSDRPGADGSDFGAHFDGSDDYLATNSSLNAPAQFWDNAEFFPNGEFPLNYEGIFAHGISFWAKPDTDALGNGNRQDLVIDTPENGVYISGDGNWGLQFDGGGDSEVSVADTLDSSGWAHVMQLGGFTDLEDGGSAFQGALFVNGEVAMITSPGQAYDPNSSPMSVGGNQDGDGNFYSGVMDDLALFLWGDNSDELGDDEAPGGENGTGGLNADGEDWGSFSLFEDNEFIAMQIADLGIGELQDADVNLDGSVDSADISAFLTHWQKENVVNGITVGDWGTRQQGDLNLDGSTDIFDAIILRDGLAAAGAGTFDLSVLGQSAVPEPSTAVLAGAGLLAVAGTLRRRRR